jgi:hypothetical protein
MLTAYPGPQKRKSNLLNKKVMIDTDVRKKEVMEEVVVEEEKEEEETKEEEHKEEKKEGVHLDHLQ